MATQAIHPVKQEHSGQRLWIAWAITLLAALPIVLWMPTFFHFIGGKQGISLNDPVLGAFPGQDLSTPLFIFLYGMIAAFIVGIARHPALFLRTAQAYVVLLILRMISMTVLTLEPPPDLIDLQDPISVLVYPGKEPFTKDLFFSGHTAIVFLFYLAAPWPTGKWVFLLATVLVGVAVLVQHVHWTVDVLAAPVGAWLAWWLSGHTARWTARYTTSANVIA